MRKRLLSILTNLLLLLLFATAAGAATGHEEASLADAGLVEPSSIDKSIVLDIRYATDNNFTGKAVYPAARCYLRKDVATRLLRVQETLRAKGLGLKVFDCYRPYSVQEAFWKIMPDERYVLEPRRENGVIVKSSRHNRGAAVDVTLVDSRGREVPMPTGYDDFSAKAHRDYAGARVDEKANSLILERAMAAQGFEPLPTEWWHFDGPGWQDYQPLDIPFPAAAR
jgi:beta-N-acetylhexosaminidase/D-alanyl-D-alanine dipeptidase